MRFIVIGSITKVHVTINFNSFYLLLRTSIPFDFPYLLKFKSKTLSVLITLYVLFIRNYSDITSPNLRQVLSSLQLYWEHDVICHYNIIGHSQLIHITYELHSYSINMALPLFNYLVTCLKLPRKSYKAFILINNKIIKL